MIPFVKDFRSREVTAWAVAASVGAHLLSLAIPLALLQTYDRILPNQAYATTFVLASGVTVAILLEAVLRYGRAVLFARVGAAYENKMTLRITNHLMRADGKAVHALGTPALTAAVKAVGQARDFWSGNAAASLYELPFAAIYILLIAYLASWLALIPLALTAGAFVAAQLITRQANQALSDLEMAEAQRRDLTWGIFGGIALIKAMAAESMLTRRYRDAVARTMIANGRVEDRMGLMRENGSLLGQISTIAVATFGAVMVVSGHLTTGGLAASTLLAGRSIGPTMAAFTYLARLGQQREAERKIDAVLSLPEAPLWLGENGQRSFEGGTIEITGDAIAGGRASIARGSVVQVDASDGLMATQLLEAVAQLDDTLGLTVTFDGLPCAAFDRLSLKQKIVTVSTYTELIQGTLLDNLTLFSPQYNADAIKLMEQLGLNAFVDGLRRGVMTLVGPASREAVSPGIAVRIGLIRALVRRPAILCLDEVGGALDLDGMRRLMEILRLLKGHITIFLVSTNPTLLDLADMKIHAIRRGRLE